MALPDFLDHPVKESRRRLSIGSETRPVYVQSISKDLSRLFINLMLGGKNL